MASSSGVTQAIRGKLQFKDEAKWKKFSARRLELIDDLGLSTKKASEQEDRIAFVADSLRQEYGFPKDTLSDFDKLVRAGIQSVRRNRKRARIRHPDDEYPAKKTPRSESLSPQSDYQASFAQLRFEADSKPSVDSPENVSETKLPSLSSITSEQPPDSHHFNMAIDRLASFVARASPLMANGNTEFLGASILNAAAAHAVDRVASFGKIKFTSPGSLRDCILGYTVTSALVRSLGLFTLASLNLSLASCCKEFGFDAIILSLSNVYWEMINLEPHLDYGQMSSFERVSKAFASRRPSSLTSRLPHADQPSTSTSNSPKQVVLRFADKRLEFTYAVPNGHVSPDKAPPTLAELLDNCRAAFGISPSQVVFVLNLGKLVVSDEDLAHIFLSYPAVDLELSLLRPDSSLKPTLPPLVFPKFQELA